LIFQKAAWFRQKGKKSYLNGGLPKKIQEKVQVISQKIRLPSPLAVWLRPKEVTMCFASRILRAFWFLAIWTHCAVLYAQLSPGELSQAHAQLEGVRNCTQCHTVGQKVSNDKCLACHHDIKWRVEKKHGFHGSKEVQGKDCVSCHSDHHGRNFKPIRWDTKQFDHTLTGYKLTGKHQQIDCRACHKSDFVQDQHLKKLPDTWLGLRQDCTTCHNDPHQGTLKNDCTRCHNADAFKPAAFFNHSRTDFPLKGKHAQIACAECHTTEQRNGKPFQKFDGIAFGKCTACHQDPHGSLLPGDCAACHAETGWAHFEGRKRFNHQVTDFELKGAHKTLDCRACHQMESATPKTVFQDKKHIVENQCIACHKDPHDAKFGTDCASCHNETSFKQVRFSDQFNHANTGFPLVGKHLGIDCKKCHTSGHMTDPVRHASCTDCHADWHKGIFAEGGKTTDCAQCHQVQGFSPSTYDEVRHNAVWALKGGHISTPCVDCHKPQGNKDWQFRNLGKRCNDCHKDVHDGSISSRYYPEHDCTVCHSPESWTSPVFVHEITGFVLESAHQEIACKNCHVRDSIFAYGKFSGTSTACAACHEDKHSGQFSNKSGETRCDQCHLATKWETTIFDHQTTRFPLEGKHATTKCSACHTPDTKGFVLYKNGKLECRDCHL
jgi:hypothetical protein